MEEKNNMLAFGIIKYAPQIQDVIIDIHGKKVPTWCYIPAFSPGFSY